MSRVYLISTADWTLGRIKIGRTSNPRARLSALQTGSPFRLQLLAYFEGGHALEWVLHQTFAPLRLHGEWFSLDHKLRDLASNLLCEGFGEAPVSAETLREMLQECVLIEEPWAGLDPLDHDGWRRSANVAHLHKWLRGAGART